MKVIQIVIVSLFALALPLRTSATVVQTVDQPFTTEASRWAHRVDEAGDYQIGMAWIEVKSAGSVDLRVLACGKQVKLFHARSGLAPLRFETRIEGISKGDTIEIEAVPVRGTRYRIGYQIAFCTPTFDRVKVFDVADYGAAGNGRTDDMAAITRAVAAAKNAGGGIVRFDGSKTYRLIGRADLTIEPVFDLEGASNIKIEGNGATLMIHPPDRMANIAFAENIHIDGFTVDYDPKPYYQGTITDIDVNNMTIDIDVPDRYPVPEVGISPTHAPFFGRSFIPDAPGARSGHGHNLYIEEVTRVGNERQLRLQIRKDAKGSATPSVSMRPRVQHADDNGATEFVVPHIVYGHLGGNNIITQSSRVKLSNIRYHCAPYFWMNIISNTGPVTLSNVDIQTPHPETELYVTWRDGMHIKNGRWGILIEDGDWDGAAMYDDTFALYSRMQVLVSTTGNVATLTPSFQGRETFLWQPGDWASFWSADQGILRGMARVVGAKDVVAPNYAVALESMPTGVKAGDVVLHEESLNRNTVIRNCTTTSVGTESSTTRFRGTDVLFQNNHFEEFDFRLEFNDRLGTPRARNVVVENTYISSVDGRVTLSRPLGVAFKGCTLDGVDVFCRHGAENVYFDDVAWTNMTGNILNLSNGSQAWLFGGSRRNGNPAGLSDWIEMDAGSAIQYKSPRNYPLPNHPPQSVPSSYQPKAAAASTSPGPTVALKGKWHLAFQDEFTGTDADLDATWEFQNGPSGHILCSRWRENAELENGILRLIGRKEKRGGQEWTAASCWTKKTFKYGYYECRYRYLPATGTNNSFWIMDRLPYGSQGKFEIDINEGHYPNEISMNLHNWSGKHWARGSRWYSGKGPGQEQVDAGFEFILDRPIAASKLRLRSREPMVRIMEFRAFAPSTKGYPSVFPNAIEAQPDVENLCRNAKATASSVYEAKYGEDKAIDGKLGTDSRWVSSSKEIGAELVVTFPERRQVGCIQFISGWQQGNAWRDIVQDFNIDYWDGAMWQQVPGASRNGLDSDESTDGKNNLSKSFHVYSLLWNEEELVHYFDGKPIYRTKNDICHGPAHVWLSLAIMIRLGPVTDELHGKSMDVDYVRIWQQGERLQ